MQLTRRAFLQAMSAAAFFTAAPAVWLSTTRAASPPSPPCREGSLKTPLPNWNAQSNSSA